MMYFMFSLIISASNVIDLGKGLQSLYDLRIDSYIETYFEEKKKLIETRVVQLKCEKS